jgi:hypothetical protein
VEIASLSLAMTVEEARNDHKNPKQKIGVHRRLSASNSPLISSLPNSAALFRHCEGAQRTKQSPSCDSVEIASLALAMTVEEARNDG